MPLLPLKFGPGSTLDVDETTVKDGSSLSLVNMYEDRGEAKRTIPGNTLFAALTDFDGGENRNVYTYDSANFDVLLAVTSGRVFKVTSAAAVTEITGATLDETAVPSFAEDTESIFIAANSQIYQYDPAGTTVVGLGALPTPEDEEAPDFVISFVEEGTPPDHVLITIKADGAKSIYYTTDGTLPDNTKTLYTAGSKIAVNSSQTVKAIAYDGDDRPSNIVTKDYIILAPNSSAPTPISFVTGTVENNTISIITSYATDNVGVTGYCIAEVDLNVPDFGDSRWLSDYTNQRYYSRYATAGTRTIRLWSRDANGNSNYHPDHDVAVAFQAAVTTPDPFTFETQTDINRGAYVESEAIAMVGLTFETAFSISNGEYKISKDNGATWTNWRTASGTFDRTDVIKIRHQASNAYSTDTVTTLTVGGVEGTFTSTTKAEQLPRNVTQIMYQGGYLIAIGQPAEGANVPGDVMYSDDKVNNYAAWEVYNNESNPDKVQAIMSAFDRVYNIGLKSLEVSVIDGVTPFAVNRNAYQHYGTMAPNSVAFDTESIFYLTEIAGARKIVQLKNGAFPKIISIPIDVPLERMGTISDTRGYTMGFRGQNFYVLDFSATVTLDGQEFDGITLAYHLQKEAWIIFGKYDADESIYRPYRGCSFTYVERWNKGLIGGRDGKIYVLTENEAIDYTTPPTLTHRWQNNHNGQWSNPRNIKLYPLGDTRLPPDQHQCGYYRVRRHELAYTDTSDAGEIFRAVAKTGWISHGRNVDKISEFYRYDVKRGSNDFVLNGIDEEVTALRR